MGLDSLRFWALLASFGMLATVQYYLYYFFLAGLVVCCFVDRAGSAGREVPAWLHDPGAKMPAAMRVNNPVRRLGSCDTE